MNRLIDFLLFAYAPLAARFHLVERTEPSRAAETKPVQIGKPARVKPAPHRAAAHSGADRLVTSGA